jgi:phage gpG-like protein
MAGTPNFAAGLQGLNIQGGLVMPRITFSPTIGIAAGRINKFGMNIKSFREPLKRSIQQVIIPSIRRNFDEGGRPAWVPLADATIDLRMSLHGSSGGGPLVRSGELRRTMSQFNIWDVNDQRAILAHLPSKVWYGAIHQAGYGRMAKRTSKSKIRDYLTSLVDRAEDEGSKGLNVNIPARPFVVLQENDLDDIYQVFGDWLEERWADAWPRGLR